MTDLVCELIITLDGFARGKRSPGYYGYSGPDFDDWVKTNSAVPHRKLIGRKTYELLNACPTRQKMKDGKRWLHIRAGSSRAL